MAKAVVLGFVGRDDLLQEMRSKKVSNLYGNDG